MAQIIMFSEQNSGLTGKKRGGRENNNGPARYDLNQIPYEFAVEVRSRFKGLDLVNSA